MSLPLPEPDAIPEETARLARAINPKGTLYMQIRDQLGIIYENQDFASVSSACTLYPGKGGPARIGVVASGPL